MINGFIAVITHHSQSNDAIIMTERSGAAMPLCDNARYEIEIFEEEAEYD
jgi:hypothetical protein